MMKACILLTEELEQEVTEYFDIVGQLLQGRQKEEIDIKRQKDSLWGEKDNNAVY